MKTALSLLVSLSMLPLVSTARMAKPLIEKPVSPIILKDSAFKAPSLNLKSSVCGPGSECLSSAEKNLSREAKRAINRTSADKESAEAIGAVLQSLPAVSAGLQAREAKAVNNALIAAITQSAKENWEPETQANVVTFANSLALDPVANQKKLEEVRENCRL